MGKVEESGIMEAREATVDTKPSDSEEKKCEQAHDIKGKPEDEIEKKIEQHSETMEVEEATGEDEEPTIVEEEKCQKTQNLIAETKSVKCEKKIEEKTEGGEVEESAAEVIRSEDVNEKETEKVHDEIESKAAGESEKKTEEQGITMAIDEAYDVEKKSAEEKERGEALENTEITESEGIEKQIPEQKEIKEKPTEAEITTVKHIVNESPQEDTLTSIPVVDDENAKGEVKAVEPEKVTIAEKTNAEEDMTQILEGNVGTKTKKTEEQTDGKPTASEAKIETKDPKTAVQEEKSQKVQVDKQNASEKVEPKPKVKSKKKKSSSKKKSKKAKKMVKAGKGVKYRVMKRGKVGENPAKKGDLITLLYAGCLKDGTLFDRNLQDGLTFKIGGGDVIPGIEVGVLGMCAGEKRFIIIPSEQGYGQEGTKDGNIPP